MIHVPRDASIPNFLDLTLNMKSWEKNKNDQNVCCCCCFCCHCLLLLVARSLAAAAGSDTSDIIGKTPVRIILWCLTTKTLIKACFLIQPLEQEGGCQKCCISLCSKVFINQMTAGPEFLNILIY